MRALDNRFDVDTIRAAKRNMRKRHQTGRVVDGFQNVFQPYGDSIIGADRFDCGARARLRVPDVLHRRKIKCRGNDLVPLIAREIKTGSDARKGDGSVRLNLDRAGVTTEKARDAIANLRRHFPPARRPGILAGVMFPGVIISEHRFARRARHGTETVTQ